MIQVSEDLNDRINSLINRGRYRDTHSFIELAIRNQIYLEELELSTEQADRKETANLKSSESDFPEFKELGLNWSNVKVVHRPDSNNIASKYLMGLHNRIFPVKLALRVLANHLDGIGEYVDLNTVQDYTARVAQEVGSFLEGIDRKKASSRGETLATGFPTRSPGSLTRFKQHFVGYSTKEGVIYGMPATLAFVDISYDQKIGITTEGLKFAELTNPILDNKEFITSLSDDETTFYLKHVKSNLSEEWKAMHTVLDAIDKGRNTRDNILHALMNEIKGNWSEAVWNSMLTGLLSRIRELKLISVNYDKNKAFYSKMEAKEIAT